jgi:uracil-DNA glycosylase family 4
VPPTFDSATQQALAARIRFYRDLGLTEFYRRPVDPALAEQLAALGSALTLPEPPQKLGAPSFPRPLEERLGDHEPTHTPSLASGTAKVPNNMGAPHLASEMWEGSAHPQPNQEQPIPPRKSITAPPAISELVAPAGRAAALQIIRDEIGDCTRCALHTGRNKLVFGDGSPNARLMFVGEGPGADEDAQGIPFVGKAGQLLNNMITAMGLKREEVYIANVVKCRPPANRTPEPDEANTCSPFLFRQIDVVRPDVLVALGATAATYLLGQRQPLAGLRGRVHPFRGTKLIVTYHPAFLLRDPRQKKEAWADLQIAMRELGLKAPAKG